MPVPRSIIVYFIRRLILILKYETPVVPAFVIASDTLRNAIVIANIARDKLNKQEP